MKRIVLALIIILLFVIGFQTSLTTASDEATSIQAANSSINHAFSNVLAAEHAGANVTKLLIRLDNAGGLLSEAENSYQRGNLVNVISQADTAALIATQVSNDANSLKISSLVDSENQFALTVAFSAVTISALIVSLLLIWQRFKQRYYKKLLSSKPEVVDYQN